MFLKIDAFTVVFGFIGWSTCSVGAASIHPV